MVFLTVFQVMPGVLFQAPVRGVIMWHVVQQCKKKQNQNDRQAK